jgi:hypothetical protein
VNTSVRGTIPYFFITDDSVREGMERLVATYPRLEIRLVGNVDDAHVTGSEIMVAGKWMDVFRFISYEYSDCDAEDALMNVARLEPEDTGQSTRSELLMCLVGSHDWDENWTGSERTTCRRTQCGVVRTRVVFAGNWAYDYSHPELDESLWTSEEKVRASGRFTG